MAALDVADLNSDGNLDAVVSNLSTHELSVLVGNGDGSFEAAPSLVGGLRPISVVLADLDADGAEDIVTLNRESEDISWFRGSGRARFEPALHHIVGDIPEQLLATDLDDDGLVDLMVSGPGRGPQVVFGRDLPEFESTRRIKIPGAVALAVGDMNGDGYADIVTGNLEVETADPDTLGVSLGGPNGRFAEQLRVDTGRAPTTIELADFDEDGALDVVTRHIISDRILIHLNTGDGQLAPRLIFESGGTGLRDLAVGDVNGDGHVDVVSANALSDDLSILLGDGRGNLQLEAVVATNNFPFQLLLGDLNADGFPDLVVPTSDGNKYLVEVHYGSPAGFVESPTVLALPNFVIGMTLVDWNEDGALDITISGPVDSWVLWNDNRGGFQEAPQALFPNVVGYALNAEDLDGDGHPEFIAGAFSLALARFGEGSLPGEVAGFGVGKCCRDLAVLDLDGDNDLDVIGLEHNEKGLLLIRNRARAAPSVTAPQPGG